MKRAASENATNQQQQWEKTLQLLPPRPAMLADQQDEDVDAPYRD